MTYKEYRNTVQELFAKYGFIECPLMDYQIGNLHQMGASIDQAYDIGCDIGCGVDPDTAFNANLDCRPNTIRLDGGVMTSRSAMDQ